MAKLQKILVLPDGPICPETKKYKIHLGVGQGAISRCKNLICATTLIKENDSDITTIAVFFIPYGHFNFLYAEC